MIVCPVCNNELSSYTIPDKKIGNTEYWKTKYYCFTCNLNFHPSEAVERKSGDEEGGKSNKEKAYWEGKKREQQKENAHHLKMVRETDGKEE